MEDNKKELHITRIRAKGEPDFYDPGADVRKVVPAVTNISINYLKMVYKEDPEAVSAFDYLYRCFKVFQIRLAEDVTPVCQQVKEYEDAVAKVDPKYWEVWRNTQQSLLVAVYALFVRRDIKVDDESMRRMFNYAHLAKWKDVLPEALFQQIRKELADQGLIDKLEQSHVADGMAVCAETGRVIQNIKSAAAVFIGGEDMTWNEAGDACDREFTARCEKSDAKADELTVLALAYPTYEHNELGIKLEDNGHQGEAGAPAGN